MPTMTPYADDATAISIGELKIENGQDQVALYGSLNLTRDKAGLQQARALKALVDDILHVLEADKNLPASVAPPERPTQVKNPFG
jgi:hypothetical protein